MWSGRDGMGGSQAEEARRRVGWGWCEGVGARGEQVAAAGGLGGTGRVAKTAACLRCGRRGRGAQAAPGQGCRARVGLQSARETAGEAVTLTAAGVRSLSRNENSRTGSGTPLMLSRCSASMLSMKSAGQPGDSGNCVTLSPGMRHCGTSNQFCTQKHLTWGGEGQQRRHARDGDGRGVVRGVGGCYGDGGGTKGWGVQEEARGLGGRGRGGGSCSWRTATSRHKETQTRPRGYCTGVGDCAIFTPPTSSMPPRALQSPSRQP